MELRPTDHVILKHVGLYHLTFREAVDAVVFPEGGNAGNALSALTRSGFLKDEVAGNPLRMGGDPRRPKSGRKYYLLGPEALKLYRLPKERTQAPSTASLRRNLATLWFCCLEPERRYRLKASELLRLFEEDAPHHNIPHCVGVEEDGPALFRVYATTTDVKSTIKQARSQLEDALSKPKLRAWVDSGDYGFSILAERKEKCDELKAELSKPHGKEPALTSQARFVVGLGPSPATLSEALRARKEAAK